MIKKFITKVKQWRIIGYVILIVEFFKIHEPQQAIIESFLLVVLGEISARTNSRISVDKMREDILNGKTSHSDIKSQNIIGTNSQKVSNSSSIDNIIGNKKNNSSHSSIEDKNKE